MLKTIHRNESNVYHVGYKIEAKPLYAQLSYSKIIAARCYA